MTAQASLNKAIQSIDVCVLCNGTEIRALVLSEVLEDCFDSSPTPEGWLLAYAKHSEAINAVVCRRRDAVEQEPIVLRSGDFS